MGLADAIAGIADALSGLSGVDVVLTAPPEELTEHATVFLWERPGESAADTNSSFRNTDTVYVEYHRLIALQPGSVVADTRAVLDAMRARLWARGKTGFNGTVTGLTAINTEGPAPAEYGEAVTFTFRLGLSIVHGSRIGS